MKKEIIIFVIGLLLGAIISTGSMYIYSKINSNNNSSNGMQMQMTNGENMQTPPDKPTDNQNVQETN